MITYRSFKKLLGETSLERKCRYLFGAALLGLIAGSFWLHAAQTGQLVQNQEVISVQALVRPLLMQRHFRRYAESAPPPNSQNSDNSVPNSLSIFEKYQSLLNNAAPESSGIRWSLTPIDEDARDDNEADARQYFQNTEDFEYHLIRPTKESRELRYFEGILAEESCLQCHRKGGLWNATPYTPGELVAVAAVTKPLSAVDQELSFSHAILVGSAIITTGLAMLAAYIIVRYIIVKPVLHLKDVSDAIAMGNLTQRAEITTGDEFEELSHAFNRMLRHMTTVNDELRTLNDNLDAKVDQLAKTNYELFSNNRLKDDFLATVSHELRTPLNSILGFSDLLASAAGLDDRQKRYVENIQTSGRNLMHQINDLLDLAKIESGQMQIQAGEVDLDDLIERLVQQITPLAEQKNIDLRIIAPEPQVPSLHQDAGKLRQIFINLLSNAIKFTPEGGRVRVSSRLIESAPRDATGDSHPQFEVAVEDTGIGIPLQQQEDIFEKFRQGATASGERDHAKREYEGTGLGLSIVRELSRLLGGDVLLESEFGKGSVFTVTLPLVAPEREEEPEPTLETPSGVLSQITAVNLMESEDPRRTEALQHDLSGS